MYYRVVILTKLTFDSMENQIGQAIRPEIVGAFVDRDGKSGHTWAEEWIGKQPPEPAYKGWDGETYPRYTFEVVQVLNQPASPI